MIFTQGIAGGTLLYVVMFEVLNRERTKNVAGLVQLAGILVGFASMLMIEIFGEFFTLIRNSEALVPVPVPNPYVKPEA